jgi:hypothetical protein
MRQVGGLAKIQIFDSDGLLVEDILPPNPTSEAWQWVGAHRTLNRTSGTLTIRLVQNGDDGETAYFDDLCVSFSSACKSLSSV